MAWSARQGPWPGGGLVLRGVGGVGRTGTIALKINDIIRVVNQLQTQIKLNTDNLKPL